MPQGGALPGGLRHLVAPPTIANIFSLSETRGRPAQTFKSKPKIGPRAFEDLSESVVRLLQAGEVVEVEVALGKGDSRHALRILDRLVWLAEGVGEVQLFETGDHVGPRVVLAPISPPSGEAGSPVPAVPSGTH